MTSKLDFRHVGNAPYELTPCYEIFRVYDTPETPATQVGLLTWIPGGREYMFVRGFERFTGVSDLAEIAAFGQARTATIRDYGIPGVPLT